MLRNAFLKTLSETRRALVWWSLGLIGMAAMMIAVYPAVRDDPDLDKMVEDYPEALKAFMAFGGNLDYMSSAGLPRQRAVLVHGAAAAPDRCHRRRGAGDRRRGGARHVRPPAGEPAVAPPPRRRTALDFLGGAEGEA